MSAYVITASVSGTTISSLIVASGIQDATLRAERMYGHLGRVTGIDEVVD